MVVFIPENFEFDNWFLECWDKGTKGVPVVGKIDTTFSSPIKTIIFRALKDYHNDLPINLPPMW